MRDHIHLLMMIPRKFSVAHTVGFLKEKSAIRIFRDYLQVKRNFTGATSGHEAIVLVQWVWMSR